jgi:hypothetical protein
MTAAIAPHEGNELRMVLAGTKPLAVIELAKQPEQYYMALQHAGAIGLLTLKNDDGEEGPEIMLVLPKNSHLFARYLHLHSFGVEKYGIKEYHRKMGALFGYSPEDIELFINTEVDCECSKCRGAK